jgi:hypothetical protein
MLFLVEFWLQAQYRIEYLPPFISFVISPYQRTIKNLMKMPSFRPSRNQKVGYLAYMRLFISFKLYSIRPRLHEIGTKSNWNENWNYQHVYMRPVRKSQNFHCIPLAGQLYFLAFVSMCCSNVKVTSETGLKCICVYIHPSLNSCRSEVSRLGPAGGMTWDRSELFSSRSHVNIYYT